MKRLSPQERDQSFFAMVEPCPTTGCWLWMGAITWGYGRFGGGRGRRAHRWSYERFVGPIPQGLQIDHLCRVKCCVNPDHLEAVTPRENTMRGVGIAATNANKTHCVRGHQFKGANLITSEKGRRRCRECFRAHQREAYASRKGEQINA